ncbi:unnamed protein product [Arabis nemorensis]|uniref:Uncharacterized protein n=1 Tax=Arabis nemorensis TaxID=586526 RepID=A0A565BLG7_9BRAS|nr:unnamed protein product [Arabis nemorensis]
MVSKTNDEESRKTNQTILGFIHMLGLFVSTLSRSNIFLFLPLVIMMKAVGISASDVHYLKS